MLLKLLVLIILLKVSKLSKSQDRAALITCIIASSIEMPPYTTYIYFSTFYIVSYVNSYKYSKYIRKGYSSYNISSPFASNYTFSLFRLKLS